MKAPKAPLTLGDHEQNGRDLQHAEALLHDVAQRIGGRRGVKAHDVDSVMRASVHVWKLQSHFQRLMEREFSVDESMSVYFGLQADRTK